jgi:predicted outer membrane protein
MMAERGHRFPPSKKLGSANSKSEARGFWRELDRKFKGGGQPRAQYREDVTGRGKITWFLTYAVEKRATKAQSLIFQVSFSGICFAQCVTRQPKSRGRRKEKMIKQVLSIGAGALALAFVGSAWAQDAATLLNKANQMNYEETETAKWAHDKAGDNQALMTYADTIKGDHEANEEAVSALSRQKSIKLDGTNSDKIDHSPMKDMKGGAFNEAYLTDQVNGHKEALSTFKSAQGQFKGDPDMELYIQQTLPVLQAHLKMAENLKAHVSMASTENPANNKSTTGGKGDSVQN